MTNKEEILDLPAPEPERKGLLRAAYNPLEVIQGLIGLTIFIFGLYLVSPFYVTTDATATAKAFAESIMQRVLTGAIFFVIPSLPTIIGFFSKTFRLPVWRARANFSLSISIFFLTFLAIIGNGINPPVWAFYLALGLVTGVMYLYWHLRE